MTRDENGIHLCGLRGEAMPPTRFRKKPVVIEAFQMTPERRQSNHDWPAWLSLAWNGERYQSGSVSCENYPNSDGTDRLVIWTLEGKFLVEWNDWIIQGVKGELYLCKPDIFEATYEAEEAAVTKSGSLRKFAETCANDFDCDSGAHKYGTFCRACKAIDALAGEPA